MRLILSIAFAIVLSGCATFHESDRNSANRACSNHGGVDYIDVTIIGHNIATCKDGVWYDRY